MLHISHYIEINHHQCDYMLNINTMLIPFDSVRMCVRFCVLTENVKWLFPPPETTAMSRNVAGFVSDLVKYPARLQMLSFDMANRCVHTEHTHGRHWKSKMPKNRSKNIFVYRTGSKSQRKQKKK